MFCDRDGCTGEMLLNKALRPPRLRCRQCGHEMPPDEIPAPEAEEEDGGGVAVAENRPLAIGALLGMYAGMMAQQAHVVRMLGRQQMSEHLSEPERDRVRKLMLSMRQQIDADYELLKAAI